MKISIHQEYSRKLESILIHELKNNMLLTSKSPVHSTDWSMVTRNIHRSNFLLKSIHKKVVEMDLLKEVMQLLSKRRFEEVRRIEVKQKTSRKNLFSLWSITLRNKEEIFGFAAIILIPELCRDIEKSRGIVYAAKHHIASEEVIKFEKAIFQNYQQEVRPQIEILGNLYRRTRRL
ncbi:MAG: hypothetical protein QF381_01290 [Nitrososphaerales archaeon]|nr:hypothetical protein [Nitrososphaerales archaeon]